MSTARGAHFRGAFFRQEAFAWDWFERTKGRHLPGLQRRCNHGEVFDGGPATHFTTDRNAVVEPTPIRIRQCPKKLAALQSVTAQSISE